MHAQLLKLFRLQPGELKLLGLLGALLMGNAFASQLSDVVAVSGFLSAVGVNQILLVWLTDMVMILGFTTLQSLIIDRFNRMQLLTWMCVAYSVLLLVIWVLFNLQMPSWLNYSLLYLLAEQQLLFFPLVFWILANDMLSMAQTKRLFPLIATGSFVGQILGLSVGAIAPALLNALQLQSKDLLIFNLLIYLLVVVLIRVGFGAIRSRQTYLKPESALINLQEGWDFVSKIPLFKYLVISILLVNVCLTIFEFRFLVVSNEVFTDASSYQRFYSLYRLGLILSALAIQGLATSRIIAAIQIKNSLLCLPLAQLIGVIWMTLIPSAIGGIGGFSLSKVIHLTIDETAKKSLQALVPEERRGRVSMFMDSYVFALGTMIGCIVLGVIILFGYYFRWSQYFYAYLAIALLSIIVVLWTVVKIQSVYESSLLNWRLKRRQRSKSILDNIEY